MCLADLNLGTGSIQDLEAPMRTSSQNITFVISVTNSRPTEQWELVYYYTGSKISLPREESNKGATGEQHVVVDLTESCARAWPKEEKINSPEILS